MAKKYSKNLSRVQDMVDGNYNHKIKVGFSEKVEPTPITSPVDFI